MRRIIFVVFCLFFWKQSFSLDSEPKIGTVDGNQFICVTTNNPIISVKIEIPPNYARPIDYFEIEWSSPNGGAQTRIVPGSLNPPNQQLQFNLGSFIGSCVNDIRGNVTLFTYLKNESDPVNNSFIPTFRQPPTAKINDDSLAICLGETFFFDGSQSCPPNITEYEWTIDGQKFYGQQVSYTFPTSGNKIVKLKVTNQCGTDEDQITINVRPLPEAIAESDANSVANIYEICLNDLEKGVIVVDGNKSKNATKYEWFVLDSASSSYSIQEVIPLIEDQKKKKIVFTRKGTYKIVLKVSMPCNYPDYDTLTVRVLDREPVFLNPISDTCGPISYSPPTNIVGTKYFINGDLTTTFPKTLNAGEYEIEARYENRCGPTEAKIKFFVFEPQNTRILSPRDTIVCRGSGPIPLRATPPTGRFVPSAFITGLPGANFFNPSAAGTYTVTFSSGIGNCVRTDSIRIQVVDAVVLSLAPQPDVCNTISYTPQPLILGATYTINGSAVTSFPFVSSTPGQYIVRATFTNACETKNISDTFNITAPQDVFFLSPVSDTTLCRSNEEVEIIVNIPGGTFTPTGKIVTRNNRYFYTPSAVESFTITYSFGIGNCARTTSRRITVIDEIPLTLNAQADVCNSLSYRPEPFSSQATYKVDGVIITQFPIVLNTPKEYIIEASLQNACGTKVLRDTFKVTNANDVRFLNPAADTVVCKDGPNIPIRVSVPGGSFNTVQGLFESNGQFFFRPDRVGDFTITYSEGIGQCLREASLSIKVLEGIPLELTPQADVCNTLNYTPSPFNTVAAYTINGVVQSTFPLTLTEAKTYLITATLANECGSLTLRDTFELTVPQNVFFQRPAADTTLCISSAEFEVAVSVPGGIFNTIPGLQIRGSQAFFKPESIGEFSLVYSQGFDQCLRSDTARIRVLDGIPLELNPQVDVCNAFEYTPDPLDPSATYTINEIAQSTFPVSLSDANTYLITATLGNECGELTLRDTFVLTVPLDVRILSPAADTVVCLSSNRLPIIGSVTGGSFAAVPGLEVSGDTAFLNLSTPGTYVIRYSEGFDDCFREDSVVVEVIESNILELDDQEDVCDELSYIPSPLNSLATYTINGNPALDFPEVLSPGSYQVLATLTDACGTKLDSTSFTVYQASDVRISGTRDTSVCAGTGLLPLLSSVPDALFSGDQLQVIDNQTYFSPSMPGIFTIVLTLDLNSCSLSDSISIEVIGLAPEADSFRVCSGTTVIDLTATPPGGVWSSPTCQGCVDGNIFTVPQSGNYEAVIVYTLTNDIGCVATDTGLITVLEPKSVFELEGAACSAGVNFDTAGTVAEGLIWYINDSLAGSPPFIGLATGSYQIKLIAVVEQCSDSSVIEIFVIEPPVAAADFSISSDSVCTPYRFFPEPLGEEEDFLTYEWVIDYDGSLTIIEGFELVGGFEFINTTPFDKQALIRFNAFNVCDTISKDTLMTILAIPESQIGIDSSRLGCSPYTIALSNRSQGRYENCLWIIEGDTVRNCGAFINYTFTTEDTSKTYIIELVVGNECGSTSYFDSVTVVPPGITAFFNTPSYEVCPNTLLQFEDASTPRPISWYWSFGDGTVSDLPNPTHTYTQPNQLFEVKLIVSAGCGYDSITRIVETKDIPNVEFIIPIYGCQFQQVDSILQTNYRPGQKFIWDFGNGNKDSTNINPRPIFEQGEQTYPITLTVFDAETGCPNSLTKNLEIKNQPAINFLLDSLICYKDEIEILNNTLYANDYVWIYNNVPIQQSQDPLIIFNETGEQIITLIASFNGRCVDSVSKVVFVRRCDVYIPNLFTPNNDGKNDFFTAYGGVNVRMIRKMKIFDRWGSLVFEKDNIPPNVEVMGWDGSIDTRSKSYGASPAVFMYWMEIEFIDGDAEFFKGDVTLIR
jgi:gliding motility-associated-like protein